VAALAVDRIRLPRMGAMAGAARLQPMATEAPMHRGQRVRARMTSRSRARLERALWRRLRVGIVAAPALRSMRLVFRRENPHSFLHLVTAETLLVGGDQRGARRIDGIPLDGLHRELVTHGAMQVGLLRHLAEFHLHVVVTA